MARSTEDVATDDDVAPPAAASSSVRVAPARERDLARTAELHVMHLCHGLFPHLGVDFVRRWHRVHHYSAYGVVLVAIRAGEVVGFLLGTTDQRRHVSWTIQHHRRELVPAAARAMLARPGVTVDFLRTRGFRYAARLFGRADGTGHSTSVGSIVTEEPVAVLEAVVVEPVAQGSGAGRALVERFLSVVARAGVDRVDLVTKAGPDGAAGFYERSGWKQVGHHVDRDGELALTFRIDPRPWSTAAAGRPGHGDAPNRPDAESTTTRPPPGPNGSGPP